VSDAKRSSRPLWQCSSSPAGERTDNAFSHRSAPRRLRLRCARACGALTDERRVVADSEGARVLTRNARRSICRGALRWIRVARLARERIAPASRRRAQHHPQPRPRVAARSSRSGASWRASAEGAAAKNSSSRRELCGVQSGRWVLASPFRPSSGRQWIEVTAVQSASRGWCSNG
jgi:hypothetical protein